MRWLALLVAVGCGAACGDNRHVLDAPTDDNGECIPVVGTNILFRQIATIPGSLVLVTAPRGDRRQFVVEQQGRIWIIERGQLAATPFLDISIDAGGPVVCCGERGLLGLAFAPDYETTGTFYVFYTTDSANVVARYRASGADRADPASAQVVLSITDPFSNHNGGMIEFGRDGMLYIGTGDGGGFGDPGDRSQDPRELLGKMLRIDVSGSDGARPYRIPVDNPFADGVSGAPELWMTGLRNPWRWSFDRDGAMWIGDVGQGEIEELDYLPAAAQRGANLGWSALEGNRCFKPPCTVAPVVAPVVERTHIEQGWCSIIGGAVYSGKCAPSLAGKYLFTDYCAHVLELAAVRPQTTTVDVLARPTVSFLDLGATSPQPFMPVTPSSIHADASGELFLTTVSCCGSSFIGAVYRIEAAP